MIIFLCKSFQSILSVYRGSRVYVGCSVPCLPESNNLVTKSNPKLFFLCSVFSFQCIFFPVKEMYQNIRKRRDVEVKA